VSGIPFPFFESINDPTKEGQSGLLPADILGNNVCSMSWVPSPTGGLPTFSAIYLLQLNFDEFVVNDNAPSGNPLLGNLNFPDCSACFRVQIQLVDANGVSQGSLILNLGTDGPNFTTDYVLTQSPLVFECNQLKYGCPPSNTLGQLRVDTSGMLAPKGFLSFDDAQKNGNYGKLFVKAITVVIDSPQVGNHLVKNLEVIVGRADIALNTPPSSPPLPSSSLNPNSSKDAILT